MGDFKPYLLKSTDAGTTWASVAGNLPERGTVYCIAEDHVDKNLLFAGTEFGLFVSKDGGKDWTRMKTNFPTIQVKDLVIQRHNNDLVVATFGRGFYVLDDYSPLRTLKVEAPKKPVVLGPKAAMLYYPTAQYGGRGTGFQGAALYTGEAAAHGPVFTVRHEEAFKSKRDRRKEAEKAAVKDKKDVPVPTLEELRAEEDEVKPTLVLAVADKSGEVIRRVNVPYTAGVHRVEWDMREAGASARGRGGRGPMATPGDYTVTLVKRAGDKDVTLSDAVAVTLTPDPLVSLKPEDYAAIAAFNAKGRALQRRLAATVAGAAELASRLDGLLAAVESAEKPDATAREAARKAIEAVKLSRRALSGDPFAAARNENSPTTIADRVGAATGATDDAFARPTGTARQAATDAATLLETELTKLHAVQDDVIPKLEAAAGGVAPGKLPPAKSQAEQKSP
jgi:hypothetical protein